MTWKREFKQAVLDTIIKDGIPVSKDKYLHWIGWQHDDPASVRRQVDRLNAVDYELSTFDDSEWLEFAGTDMEPDRVRGMDANIVLLDGRSFTYRYTGTFSELLQSVLGKSGS